VIRAVTREYKRNGTKLGKGIESIECRLSKENNIASVTISDNSYGCFHTHHKNGKISAGPRGKFHLLVSLTMKRYKVKGKKFR